MFGGATYDVAGAGAGGTAAGVGVGWTPVAACNVRFIYSHLSVHPFYNVSRERRRTVRTSGSIISNTTISFISANARFGWDESAVRAWFGSVLTMF